MSFNIIAIEPFDKQLKRLCKKHISLKKDVTELEEQLSKNPFIGSSIGSGCYKIRLAITSKGKGKSGGARIITHVFIQKNIVYLITIYDKSEVADISDKEVKKLLDFLK